MRTFTINGLFFARIRSSFLLLLALGALTAKSCAPKAYVPDTVSLQSIDSLPAQMPNLKRIEAVADSLAQSHLAGGATPGMSVAIAKDGKVVFSRGYGKADVEMSVAAGPETVYGIGSVTKQFTAAIIMRLVEAGELSLDDTITKYLPGYPVQGHHVTIRHLLNHTSGIKGFRILQEENRQRFRLDLSYEEMVELFGKQPFDFKPGEKYAYNNMGYYLLGEIISRVTGTPWVEYVERELLQPLGLNETKYCEYPRVIPNRAEGYEYEKDKLVNARYISTSVGGAAGTLCSTAGDLIRWNHLLHGGQVVSPSSLQQMTAPTVLISGDTIGYGYGLQLDEIANQWAVFHGGGANGFTVGLVHFPKEGLTFTVLTNSGNGKPYEVVKALARTALGTEIRDRSLTKDEIAQYEGTYTYRSGPRLRELRVFGENGKLKAQFIGGPGFRLLNQGEHVFVPIMDDDTRIIFSLENGRADGLTIRDGRWDVKLAKRKP